MENRFLCETRPVALKENMVVGKDYRFTVLSNRLLRLEYDPSGKFEDRASQSVFFRDFPENHFETKSVDGWLTIETDNLILTYKENEEFSAESLKIKLKINTARIGPMDDMDTRPKLSSAACLSLRIAETPTPKAMMKGTVIGPVVTPPESKAMARKSAGENIANTNTPI